MRITDINAKRKTKNAKLQFKTQNFKFWVVVFTFTFLFLPLLTGCGQKNEFKQAQDYIKKSKEYYQYAINLYKDLIAKGKDSDRLHFELGELYYNHGEWKQAIEEFKKTNILAAKKFLAISYYRLGNFTDALEVFNREEIPDDEYLYYYGLTSEKLNLFDQAISIYKKIKIKEFSAVASERLNIIEKQTGPIQIKDISPEVYKILESAPSQDEYPQAGALILFCDEKIEVTPQNTQVFTLHYIIKILNERGKEDFSESHIDYDSTYETVELEYARTIKPDGTVVEVGSRYIRDVSKYLNFPLYSNARVYIISFPEITEGSSVEYKIKVNRNQLINKKDFIVTYPLQAGEPIIAADFCIDLPKEKILHIKTLNDKYNDFGAELKPKIQSQEDRLIYSWQFKNIPEILPESNMPQNVEINPTIVVSTFSSWQEVYNWWRNLSQDKIKTDAAIKDKVQELTSEQNSEEARIKAIYNFCAQKIRYVAVEYGQAGYEPHLACDIFKNKYGDCKDQAILLVTMLKEAGFAAWPVLIPTKECYNLNEDFPSVLFNHCIAAVSVKDKLVFIDPTAETCSFGDLPADDQGRQVLIFKDDGYKIQNTPLYPAEHNLIKQRLLIKINRDETIAAEKSIFSYGMYDQRQRFWMLYTPPELIQESLKEKIQATSIGAILDNYNIKNLEDLNAPVVLNYSFKGSEYFTVAGRTRITPQLASLYTALVAKGQRKYPIDFSILDIKETICEIEIPGNLVIKYMPPSITEESPWLKFIVEYNQKNNKIYFRQKTELKKNTVSQEDYPDFKVFLEGLAKKIKQRIILEKG
ncbi:MAG: hypothetical protein COX40_07125 [Candidatus Omnitrophica bacterium CG23_combo_of_CG06-09_8_20_14_all_40_11]|nr:MAG: hypothetical protein COX40_07125 [Candidatus Omnitrophica bacterium CG23_combo_of_CG06-09_8_20_14_all_40_11]